MSTESTFLIAIVTLDMVLLPVLSPGRLSNFIAIGYFSAFLLCWLRVPCSLFAAAKERYNGHGAAPQLQQEREQHNIHHAAPQLHEREQYNRAVLQLHFPERAWIARVAMRALPPIKSFQQGDDIETGSQFDECAICMDEFKIGELVQPFGVCVHVFHASCINSWLLGGKTTCPVCREDLSTAI